MDGKGDGAVEHFLLERNLRYVSPPPPKKMHLHALRGRQLSS